MSWSRTSTTDVVPDDPLMDVAAETMSEILRGADVELRYSPVGDVHPGTPAALAPSPDVEPDPDRPRVASARGPGPPGWHVEVLVRLGPRLEALRLHSPGEGSLLREVLALLPGAALRAAASLRERTDAVGSDAARPVGAALRRAVRDTVAVEVLADLLAARFERRIESLLIEETLDFLFELSSSRVESHDLTHGVVLTNVLRDEPRLEFCYPGDVRTAKRAPLLFDGQQSVLVVDLDGRARTELQRHRIDRLGAATGVPGPNGEFVETGALVAEATRRLGGLGFFLRSDRTISAFVDGQPLLVRRGEHWTAFPLEMASSIEGMIDGGPAASLVVRAALMISGQQHGAILAIVPGPEALEGIVPLKDRYDLRNDIDPQAMRTETRLHHLIEAEDLDDYTLARLAALDGATVLDRDARLLAYGAIVASSDSEHEGARTAAARTLSHSADVVLKVSVDGDITIFRDGAVVATLLGSTGRP